MKAFFNGKIFDGKKMRQGVCVLTKDGRVTGFCSEAEIPADAHRVDLQGGILAPAFVDLQIYGGGGQFFGEFPSAEALTAMYEHCLAGGTGHFLPTVATHSEEIMAAAIEAVREYWGQGGRGVLGLHLEGPFISAAKRGAHLAQYLQKPTLAGVKKWFSQGKGILKMMTVAPEICPPEVLDFFSKQKEVVISAGHSDAGYAEALAAFDGPCRAATHLYNAMSGLHHRGPGMVGAIFNSPKVLASIVADGHHVDFEAIKIAKKLMKARLFLITDAVGPNLSGQYSHQLDGDRFVLPDGTLSGSSLTMARAVKNCVLHAGIELEEALRMASLYPARVMRLEKQFGKIGIGRVADFVLLDEKLELVARFVD